METEKIIKTENGLDKFQVRLLKNDGVGLLTDSNEKSYLILDSLDYWYELIQDKYPAKIKCTCKNDFFTVKFCYKYRENSIDIREIILNTVCSTCGKTAKRMSVDIDYAPTNDLIDKPIVYCEKPQIKYKFSNLSALWNVSDWERVLHYMENLGFAAHYFYWKNRKRIFEVLPIKQALEIDWFIFVFFARKGFVIKSTCDNENGENVENSIWRRQEIIKISKMNINGFAIYDICFCNQFIDKGYIKDKSKEFEKMTTSFLEWLKKTFTSKRGKNCFDSQEMYDKFKEKLQTPFNIDDILDN